MGLDYDDEKVVVKQNRLDQEEEQANKTFIKKHIAKINRVNNAKAKPEKEVKWRKNRMVVSLDEIKKYL